MSVIYVGIDIGKRKHEATMLDAEGNQLGRSLVFDNSQQGVAKLFGHVGKFAAERVVFGLEATGHYWLALYTALIARDCEVKVINPIQSDSLRNLETRLADEPMIQLRELSRMRVEFTGALASLKRRILGILDRIFPEFERCFSNPFGRTALEVLGGYSTPAELAECDLSELTQLVKIASRGRLGMEKARQLQETAAQSFGISLGPDAFTLELRLLVEQLQFIRCQIDELSTAIEELMQAHQLILSIPGVGPVLGAPILGEIGDIRRFASAKKLRACATGRHRLPERRVRGIKSTTVQTWLTLPPPCAVDGCLCGSHIRPYVQSFLRGETGPGQTSQSSPGRCCLQTLLRHLCCVVKERTLRPQLPKDATRDYVTYVSRSTRLTK